jgi:Bacterial transcriptional activator domain
VILRNPQARQSLRKTLSMLRQACAAAGEPVLLIDSDTVALALYCGDLLDGFSLREVAFAEWLTVERERLRGMAIGALEALLAHELRHHRVEPAIQVAHRLIALNPLHEAAHGSLMQLYARQGRRDTALQQYRLFADRLWHEVGEKPDAETQTLYRRMNVGGASHLSRPPISVPSPAPGPSGRPSPPRRDCRSASERPARALGRSAGWARNPLLGLGRQTQTPAPAGGRSTQTGDQAAGRTGAGGGSAASPSAARSRRTAWGSVRLRGGSGTELLRTQES